MPVDTALGPRGRRGGLRGAAARGARRPPAARPRAARPRARTRHTASLFPGKPALQETHRLVAGVPEAGMEPLVPRVTLTLPAASTPRARSSSSSPAPTRPRRCGARSATPPDESAPAAHVRPGAGTLTVVLDRGRRGGAAAMSDGRFIGIDVGGTKVATAMLEDGELRDASTRCRRDTQLQRRARRPAASQQIEALPRRARRDAVAIGLPSIIEFATGRVRHTVNLPLSDVPLRSLLTERCGLPVYVENDASCAALAEASDDGRIVVREPRDVHDRHRRRRRPRAQRASSTAARRARPSSGTR